jgi:PhnB protein
MPTIPYIHFDGTCAEALTFYADVFGGTDVQMMRYADAPDMPEAMKDPTRIIHGQVTLGSGVLMASDYPPGMKAEPQGAVSIMQGVTSVAAGRAAFDRLAEGGQVIQDFGPSFFSPGFGMVTDRFGTHWMLSVMPGAEEASSGP